MENIELSALDARRDYLARLLVAIQRCVFYLDASGNKLSWPIRSEELRLRRKQVDYFESLSALNERFAKLQDVMGSAMRHACLLAGESTESFLRVLVFYEKIGVLDSVTSWQLCRTTRNLAAHDYEISDDEVAGHFNAIHQLVPVLCRDAGRFVEYCAMELDIFPAEHTFSEEFIRICR